MTARADEGLMKPCKFCEKLPGTKVGPPALARCITKGCEASGLGAETIGEWNTRNAAPQCAVRSADVLSIPRLRELVMDPAVQNWPETVDGGFMKLLEIRNLLTAALSTASAQASPESGLAKFIIDGYANPDIGHETFRVKVYEAALAMPSAQSASPVMQAAEKAAQVVEGWSDAKKDYATRAISSTQSGGARE